MNRLLKLYCNFLQVFSLTDIRIYNIRTKAWHNLPGYALPNIGLEHFVRNIDPVRMPL